MKEKKILDFWSKSQKKNQETESKFKKSFVFFDGPPFANGLPHYGHLATSFYKDIFTRYHRMLSEKIITKLGWDCHGLPAEMAAEKDLKIQGRIAIKEYGVDKFNKTCSDLVLKYTTEWKDYLTRIGRWIDFEDVYKTMDIKYMESVIWAFKELYKKNLIKEEERVMPYSWKCETPLSNFETRMDNCYKEKQSQAIYIKFKLKSIPEQFKNLIKSEGKEVFLLAWTTTPWTLPSNLALAINKDEEYIAFEFKGEILICIKNVFEKIKKILVKAEN